MSHVLTETSTFTASVTVPDDGDDLLAASVETPFQAVTNRTKFLNDRLNAVPGYARYSIAANLLATGSKATLAQIANTGGYILAANTITIPSAGLYLISVTGRFRQEFSTNNPENVDVVVDINGATIRLASAVRFSATTTDSAFIAFAEPFALAAADQLSVKAGPASALGATNTECFLSLTKLVGT